MIRALVVLLVAGGTLLAQESDTTARVPQDSVLARARLLVLDGHEVDGRKLIDSVLTATTPDSARYAEALYWRGVLAATAADAERDYRRLLIEAPLASRAEDAMLQLAQLEQARGDRRGASDHLQRFLLSYPQSAARSRVSVQLVRLLFDQGPQQLARACEVLRIARTEVPASSVELRNQLDAQVPRCAFVEAQAPPQPVVDSTPPVVAADSAARANPSAANPAPPVSVPGNVAAGKTATPVTPVPQAGGVAPASAAPVVSPPQVAFYSVQVAAYDAAEAAARMVQQLVARGIAARVDGSAPPYRVRIGKYATRAEAVKAAADLKAKGHNGFITLVSPPAK